MKCEEPIAGQFDIFGIASATDKERRILERDLLTDVLIISDDNPLRKEAVKWARDFDWHMAVHECEGVLQAQSENTQERIKPVVYADFMQNHVKERWLHCDCAHNEIENCPYCGVNLAESKGTIKVERRFRNKPYHSVFEREREVEV